MTDLSQFKGLSDAEVLRAAGYPVEPAPAGPAGEMPAWAQQYNDIPDAEVLRIAGVPAVPVAPTPPVDMLRGTLAATNRGFTAGLSDPIRAAEYATGQALQGSNFPGAAWLGRQIIPPWSPQGDSTGSWVGDYQKGVADAKSSENQFADEHPIIAPVANGLGMALTLPLTGGSAAAPTLAKALIQGGKVGGEFGAAGGLATALMNPQETLAHQAIDVGEGAVLGGIGGMGLAGATRAIAPMAQNVASRFMPSYADKIAADRLAAAAQADELGQPAVNSMSQGNELTTMDVGQKNVQGLAGKVYRAPGKAGDQIDKFLIERDKGVGERGPYDPFTTGGASARALAITKEALGSDDPLLTEQAILAKQKAAADPLYEAFRAEPLTDAATLEPFMANGAFRSSVTRANNSATARGEPPLTDYFDFNEAGDPLKVKQGISPDVLDKIKQGLDDNWLAARTRGDPGDIRDANALRRRFVSMLDENYPNTYPQARAAYSGPATSLDALRQGAETFKMAQDQISQRMSELSPEDQGLFQLGGQKALVGQILNTPDSANEISKILGTPAKRMQVKALFTDPARLDQFANAMGAENRKFETLKTLAKGSQTAGRLAWDTARQNHGAEALGELLQGGIAMAAGEPMAGIAAGGKGLGKLLTPLTQPSERSNLSLAQLLMSTDPATLTRLLQTPRPPAPTLAAVLAGQGGQAAPGIVNRVTGQ